MERIICLVIGYACGLLQSGYLVGKMHHIDIRKAGSGNSGSTNALRVMGLKAGLMTFAGDVLKCFAAVLIVRAIYHGSNILPLLMMYAGAGVTLGHNVPFYMNFKGGKGIAVMAALVVSNCFWHLPYSSILFFVTLAFFLVPVLVTRYVSLGSLSNSVKALKVDGNEATAENVKAGTYKVSRPFNICYKENKLTDLDKQFIEFIMSEEGQKLVDAEGYISVGAEGNKPYEGTDAKGKITLAGSTSVAPLMDKLKDAFNKKAPNVSIEIQESGSSAGIQSAIEGAVEIGMSSRELKDEEKTELTVKQIAMDGIAVIVNNDNTLDNITSDQIKDIYTGKTTDWSDVK